MTNAIAGLDFEKLQALVDKWVVRYNHIAEITFFQVDDTKHPLGVEIVLCNPPGVAPTWRDPLPIKDGFFTYGPEALKEEIIKNIYFAILPEKVERPGGHLYDYKAQAQKQEVYADSWFVLIRWETDPSYLENMILKNKKILYSAPTVDSIEGFFRKFTAADYEHFGRLPYFTEEECLDLLLGFLSSKKDVRNPRVRLSKESQNKIGEPDKWLQNFSTNVDRIKEILDRATESGELDLFVRKKGFLAINADPFLKWAREKRFHIPIGNRGSVDDVKKIEKQHYGPPDLQKKSDPLPRRLNSDDFVKTITVRYENDSQITIQERGKQKVPVSLEQLRFRGPGLTWTAFLNVLQNPPCFYWQCPENKHLKKLKTINERLVEWINSNHKKIVTR